MRQGLGEDEAIYLITPVGNAELFYFQFGVVVIWDTEKQSDNKKYYILYMFNEFIKDHLSSTTVYNQ